MIEATDLVGAMTTDEKVDLLTGQGMWRTHGVERLGLPALVMTDGTYGVRYSISQIDEKQEAGVDLDAFLATVNRKANDVEIAWGSMKPATCFPNGSSLACSWDVELARAMGEALGVECRAMGVDVLLGPGVNIRRTPLAGRAYEYFSEDPIVTGELAAAMINGLQGQGVGASIKHFACNNSEVERTSMDSIVDMRALREIYLRGFEIAIGKSDPWTVMSAYNRLNGEQAAESHWLLTTVLREDWGYRGLVMSDWHGIKDRPASLWAGNDLDMPQSRTRRDELLEAVNAGTVSLESLDTACIRIVELVRRSEAGRAVKPKPLDHDAHHRLARKLAGESIVLLKNEGAVLPLAAERLKSLAIIGPSAIEAVIQGSGCATTSPTRVDQPLAEIQAFAGDCEVRHFPGTGSPEALAAALAGAREADVAVVFVNTEVGWDGEGSDRSTLALAEGQDALISAVALVNPRTVVVVASPDAVEMPWVADVPAVLATFFSGQAMGGAVADILFGKVNPSGKLTTSFTRSMRQIPGYLTYPGENGRHVYSEGLFVGYRSHDTLQTELLFPFGHGIGYSGFAYSDLVLDRDTLRDGETVSLRFKLTNTGAVAGRETTQVYVLHGKPRVSRPAHELKAFIKTDVAPGETVDLTLALAADDLRYYDPARECWILDTDDIIVEIAASSRDIRLQAPLKTRSRVGRFREITWDTQPGIILATPIAHAAFRGFIAERMEISEDDAEHILQHCASSFLGMATTLDRRLRQRITREEVQPLLDRINADIRAWEQQPGD
ncbi:beta-glucosidase [Novosphingobium chloroacetimidivorans]|uniref:Beta-glucosidase n=1 Tax=Novosphingobium chloroacetimidivorans TaxID=1428314 RepID=A0A7W7NYN1_9SPHN|nr:glycoside hydrolase family 3 C-terminal domain-containing protein [Novosphingobium chloroacetimidivorans]MBB4860659.1 beta-glucosidase [Novosphingobium chloroacetimidivorans]